MADTPIKEAAFPSSLLRFVKRALPIDGATSSTVRILQQKFQVWDTSGAVPKYSRDEWRDVPLEDE